MKTFLNNPSFELSTKSKKGCEVYISNPQDLSRFDSVEVMLSVYPYKQEMHADSFEILPYEEYIEDLSKGKRSTYIEIGNPGREIFGLFLGLIILILFALFKPSDIISIQSIVSILGAYTIGKEIWRDIDNELINITSQWKLRWCDQDYFYFKQDFGSIQKYWDYARLKRYGYQTGLSDRFDFITHSNSKTLEMLFVDKFLKKFKEQKQGKLRISTIYFSEQNMQDVMKNTMFAFKIMFGKKFLGIVHKDEYFQAFNGSEFGAIDMEQNWITNSVLVRKTYTFGRLKLYAYNKLIKDLRIISVVD